MRDTGQLSNVRNRSRSARERSKNLCASSQQLRASLESLRLHPAGAPESLAEHRKPSCSPVAGGASAAVPLTPLDYATLTQQRVRNARQQAQALRRRAADLRSQAAEFRVRAEILRWDSAIFGPAIPVNRPGF